MAKFKVAAAQMAPVWLDREATTAKVCDWIVEAGLRQGADLIVLPESIIPGYPHWVWVRPHDGEVAGGADSTLVISGSGRWPRRSQVRGQLRHDPIATAG